MPTVGEFQAATQGQAKSDTVGGNLSGDSVMAVTDPVTGGITFLSGSTEDALSATGYRNPEPNTLWLMGDSLVAQGYATTGNPITFLNRASEGWFNWLDASLGAPFTVIGSSAVGGKTTAQIVSEQMPLLIASGAKYCALSSGINDILATFVSGEQAAANVIDLILRIQAAGVVPIWSTLFPRSFDAISTPKIIIANDLLRQFAATNKSGLFVDGYTGRVNIADSQNGSLGATHSYDSPTFVHPNNLGAFQVGLLAAAQIGNQIQRFNFSQIGNEDVAYSPSSNLLSDPGFNSGTAGTVGANCTGTMPTGWVIDWATRTGTGSAAAAIVDVLDSATGFAVAKAIQVTISGACASNDVIRVSQSDTQNALLKSSLTTGNVIQAEGTFAVASGANVNQIAMRVQTNTTESTWWGLNGQTAVAYPSTVPTMVMRTPKMTVLGAGVATQARYDFRVSFNGAGTGTVLTFYRPRVRKVS